MRIHASAHIKISNTFNTDNKKLYTIKTHKTYFFDNCTTKIHKSDTKDKKRQKT